jgi:hypothetical protein
MNSGLFMRSAILAGLVLALAACGKSASDVDAAKTAPAASKPPAAKSMMALDAKVLAAARPVKGLRCYLDKVDGARNQTRYKVQRSAPTEFVGWVLSADKEAPASFTLILKAARLYGVEATTGGVRPDVAKVVKSERATRSGFKVNGLLGQVTPGAYRAMTLVAGPVGAQLCDMHRTIDVVD